MIGISTHADGEVMVAMRYHLRDKAVFSWDFIALYRNTRTANLDTASEDTKNHEKLYVLHDFTKVEVTGFGQ